MTIAQVHNQIKGVISEHSVYGCETIINALVRVCKDNPNLQIDTLHKMLDHAATHIKHEDESYLYERR